MHIRLCLLLVSTLFCAACAEGLSQNNPPGARLQVLGIKADKPEVTAKQTPLEVELTPLLHDAQSGGRRIQVRGRSCIETKTQTNSIPTCDGEASSVDLIIPDILPSALPQDTQQFGFPRLLGAAPSFKVMIPGGLTDHLDPVTAFNGVSYLITLEFQSGVQIEKTFKRILVSEKPNPNQNPNLKSLRADGDRLTKLPEASVKLTANVSGDGGYEVKDLSGGVNAEPQVLQMSYVVTAGQLAQPLTLATESTEWVPPARKPAQGAVSVMGLLSDSRGGLDFLILDL